MRIFAAFLTGAALFLGGCSSSPKPEAAKKKEEPKPAPEPLTGRNAFFKAYVTARSWAPDVQCLTVSSIPLAEVEAAPGKAGAWQMTVVSPSTRRKRSYTWSAVEGPGGLFEGVRAGAEDSFTPNPKSRPFLIAALKIDTDAALKVAEEKSADFIKKNPTMRTNFLLEAGEKHPNPYWRVYWGDSIGTSARSIFVDATTGQYLETRH